MRDLMKIIEAMFRPLPVDTTAKEESSRLSDDDLMEMANLGPAITGLPQGVIFISTAMGQHGPRVKYMLKPGGPSFSMTISNDPEIVANSLPGKVKNKAEPWVRQFVVANMDALMNFWSHGTDMMDEEVDAMKRALIKNQP